MCICICTQALQQGSKADGTKIRCIRGIYTFFFYTNIYISIYICIYICTHPHICICTQALRQGSKADRYTYIRIYMYAYMYMKTGIAAGQHGRQDDAEMYLCNIHIYVYISLYIRIYIYTYLHICPHNFICTQVLRQGSTVDTTKLRCISAIYTHVYI